MKVSRILMALFVGIIVFFEVDLWQNWHLTGGLHNGSLHAVLLASSLIGVAVMAIGAWLFPVFTRRVVVLGLTIRRKLGGLRWVVLAGWVVAFPYLVLYSPVRDKFVWESAHWWLYLVFSVGAAFLVAPGRQDGLTLKDFLQGALVTGASFAFLSAYVNVSSYPFSLSWSEGNRLWDYSVMFGRGRYVYPAGKPIFAYIDWGRQFLWGLVFLIPGVGIAGARFWSAFLFTAPYPLFAWTVFWKPRGARQLVFWAGLWGFLFLSQGPIYTPLLLSAWMVVVAEMALPWWAGGLLVTAAAYYAAVTRFTWLFAPALWGVLLTVGVVRTKADWKTAWREKGWWLFGGGLLGALLSGQMVGFWNTGWALLQKYLGIGGAFETATAATNTTVRQSLIWMRLWPNATYQPGILLGAILAVAPVMLLWWAWHRRGMWRLHRWAQITIGGVLILLFGAGVIISLKIGGGSNLHNLDMFLVSVLLVTAMFWRQGGEKWVRSQKWATWEKGVLLALAVVPVYFVFLAAAPRHIPEARWWEPALQAVRHYVDEAKENGGEVLFIDQRQILTFGFVKDVPLVPDYEKKYMMDQAMAGNADYFARYYHDLARYRFAVIISEPLHLLTQPAEGNDFAAENNAWVRWVSAPTLCYYRIAAVFPKTGVEILVPREEPLTCEQLLPTPPQP